MKGPPEAGDRGGSAALATAAMIVLAAVVLSGAGLLLVLGTGRLAFGLLLLGTTSLVGLVLPPLVAGAFARSFGWDRTARGRLLVGIVVLAVVQVAAAAGFGVVGGSGGLGVGPIVLVVVVAFALDAVLPLLGRTARRPARASEEGGLAAAAAAVWTRTAIGALIGAILGAALTGVVLVDDPEPHLVSGLLLALASAALGATLVSTPAYLRASHRVRDVIGDRYSSASRIGAAIRGKDVELSAEEADRAAAWAAVAPVWLRLQAVRLAIGATTSLAVMVALALDQPELRPLTIGVAVVTVVTAVAAVVSLRRSGRRFRAYASAHPRAPA